MGKRPMERSGKRDRHALTVGSGWLLLLCMVSHMRTASAFYSNYTEQRKYPIYQILTDRFGSSVPGIEDAPCQAISDNYCYGDWTGTANHLQYIYDLNFLTVWTSPITAQTAAGYHGYWPNNMYQLNPSFGTNYTLLGMLQEAEKKGLRFMLDMVVNHNGYINLEEPMGVNPFYNTSDYHDCAELARQGLCDACQVPSVTNLSGGVDLFVKQNTMCQLSNLPDLNHTVPRVRDGLVNWVKWIYGQYDFVSARFDAIGHIPPDMYPLLVNATGNKYSVGEVFVPTVDQMMPWYEPIRALGLQAQQNMAFFNYPMAMAARSVFGWETNNYYSGNHSCTLLKQMRDEFIKAGFFLPAMGMFIDNHDLDRFASINSSTSAMRNALTFTYFMEGLPFVYYGTEQFASGFNDNSTNRTPMWSIGFDTSYWGYTFIRMLNWYRYELHLWQDEGAEFRELYVSDNVYVWQRGDKALVVVKSGMGYEPSIPINTSALHPNTNMCQMQNTSVGYCITPETTSIPWPENDWEPMIFIDDAKLHYMVYFEATLEHNKKEWSIALITTICILVGSTLFMLLLVHIILPCSIAIHARRKTPREDQEDTMTTEKGTIPTEKVSNQSSDTTDSTVLDKGSDSLVVVEEGVCQGDGSQTSQSRLFRVASGLRSMLTTISQSSGDRSVHRQSNLKTAVMVNPLRSLPGRLPSLTGIHDPTLHKNDSLEPHMLEFVSRELRVGGMSNSASANNLLELSRHQTESGAISEYEHALPSFIQTKGQCNNLVVHVALEYTVPHMNLNSELMFGGLGKVVDIFLRYSHDPVALIAPVYAPFVHEDGEVHLGSPVLTFLAEVYDTRVPVRIFMTADPEGSAYFFLVDAEVFRHRTRGKIYSWNSEAEQLTFFSVFNQAVALVVQTFDIQRLQFHDYHGVLSLLYLPPAMRPEVLYVAHNADYNGSWLLTSKRRARYLYSMFNLRNDRHTRHFCEHQGRFDMLRILVEYLLRQQAGMGVVAVSPLYAPRVHQKFSQFWLLPRNRMRGVLNGIDAAERPMPVPSNIQDLFDEKKQAKRAWQKSNGLTVDDNARVFTFLGRMTHQKGVDIIVLAAQKILKAYPTCQLAMAGPVGDEYGEKARIGTDKLAKEFAGRVLNMAGQYVRGAEKEQLIMATDFFLCPSRFEPCGLADLEFAFAGGVCVGHRTGGLGKVPGYYFQEHLDNTIVLASGLEGSMHQAMRASWEEVHTLAEEAARKEFPPEEQVARYNAVWDEIHFAWKKTNAHKLALRQPMPNERNFFESMWRIDNLPGARKTEFTNTSAHRMATNILLILMQGFFQLPSFIVLLRYLEFLLHAHVPTTTEILWDETFTAFFLYFVLYAASTIVFQGFAFFCTARVYILLTAAINLVCSVLSLWSGFVDATGLRAIFIVTSVFSSMWAPLYGYIFLDTNVSVSEYGVWLMMLSSGFTGLLIMLLMMLYYFAIIGSYNRVYELFVVSVFGTIASTCIFIWLLQRSSMAAHYDWFKLRLFKELKSFVKRKTMWCMVLLSSTTAFMLSLTSSAVYFFQGETTLALFEVVINASLVAFTLIAGAILATRIGLRFGLRMWYTFVFLPGPVWFVLTVCAVWSPPTILYIITALFSWGLVRVNVAGLLTLQTLPTRTAFVASQAIYICCGSLSLAMGGLAGSYISQDYGTSGAKAWFLGISGFCEVCYAIVGALLCWSHSKETLAIP